MKNKLSDLPVSKRSREYRTRMREKGFCLKTVWVKKVLDQSVVTKKDFFSKLNKITADLSKEKCCSLYKSLLEIAECYTEVNALREEQHE